jgi:four helix bundle protein
MQEGYHKFYETIIWKESFEMEKKIFSLTKTFPRNEMYGLVDQLNRSSNSVLANIAESHGRFYFLDKIRVLYIVRGEIQEIQSHLIVSAERDYLNKETLENFLNSYEKIKSLVNKMINELKNQSKD